MRNQNNSLSNGNPSTLRTLWFFNDRFKRLIDYHRPKNTEKLSWDLVRSIVNKVGAELSEMGMFVEDSFKIYVDDEKKDLCATWSEHRTCPNMVTWTCRFADKNSFDYSQLPVVATTNEKNYNQEARDLMYEQSLIYNGEDSIVTRALSGDPSDCPVAKSLCDPIVGMFAKCLSDIDVLKQEIELLKSFE